MKIKTEKRMVEVFDTTYIAVDGKEFKSENLCLTYEEELKNEEIREEAEKLEIKELYGTYPLDVNAQYINDNHEYNWYKVNNEEEYNIIEELYGNSIGTPTTYPEIICIEHDDYYNGDAWSHLLSDMKQDTISFWKRHGYNIEFRESEGSEL